MSILGTLKDKVAQYVDVYVRLIKINLIERTASLLSYVLFALICIVIFFCIIILLGLGLVEVFNAMGLTKLASFSIAIGIYIVMLLCVIASRRAISRFFANGIIKVLTEGDPKDKEEAGN